MRDAQPQAIYLRDYQAPDFLIEKTELTFELNELVTKVTSTLTIRRNAAVKNTKPLVLNGQDLKLISVSIDGKKLSEEEFSVDDEFLKVEIPDYGQLTCVTHISPQENTSLEGLYKSSGMYCTQCEAEGFRKITYYLDRPDVMSVFTTKIIADKEHYPVLLSNGNLVKQGTDANNRHWALWEDPFKKPAYLFALVAGKLDNIEDQFITMSGRQVTLQIFVESKDLDKCDYAMSSLKNAMRWDETVYGREYDLDIFMIVAVDDFNMGAMENKGLNIFNTACVLANSKTTTDTGFQRVEGVVAHEYFHNWSGNRVTCRDWFQLSLKEGFTVFRDQAFSADMGSPTVKRIEDVGFLRTLQFAEDAGPMAHPVQPPSFIEISNFYTLTVYEKGSEIVRMLHTLLGEKAFRAGSDSYFERHDGEAVTIDDFVSAMESASGKDLSQFKNWYTQAGTPTLVVKDEYNETDQVYKLTIKQRQPDTPESKGADKKLLHMPIAMGLVGDAGCLALHPEGFNLQEQADNTHWILELSDAEQTFTFNKVIEKPVPSLLRNFSCPVKLVFDYTRDDYLRLMQNDSDGFSRWNASQQLAVSIIQEQMSAFQQNKKCPIDLSLSSGLQALIGDQSLDKAMVANMLSLPSEAYLAEISGKIDVAAIHYARNSLRNSIAINLKDSLWSVYRSLAGTKPYEPSADAIAERTLKNTALDYLMLIDDPEFHRACIEQYYQADNMTDSMAALRSLVHSNFDSLADEKASALSHFYETWSHETLVVNQWLAVQASNPKENTLNAVKDLMNHVSFSLKNPNKIRSLVGAFSSNAISFHQASGDGYKFLTEQIISLNKTNPQVASRLLTPLTRWQKYLKPQKKLMKQALEDILAVDELSKDVYEVVSKSLSEQ
ncbi:MAG: aminopeptidase N [Cellvibrionaceae bacterium]|jgi:aminopeptidase N